jgi:hypothetical protein
MFLSPEDLESFKKIRWSIKRAITSWVNNNNSHGVTPDKSDLWYDKAEVKAKEIAKKYGYDVEFDRGVGLYPLFLCKKDNKVYHEYTIDSFFWRILGKYNE